MLGIITALPPEARCFNATSLPLGQIIQLENQQLLYIGGIGATRAQQAAQHLIAAGCTALLSWGTAGALAPTLYPGDIIIPRQILSANGTRHELTPHWQEQLYQQARPLGAVHQQPLLQTETIINHRQKGLLFSHTQALAVDMESAAIAKMAEQHQLAVACVRVIVDPAHFSLPHLATNSMASKGELKWQRVLWNLLRYPYQWPAVYQLTRYFQRSQQSLKLLATLQLAPSN